MTFLEVLRFELRYQLRRRTTWIFFVAIGAIAWSIVLGNFLPDAQQYEFYVNGPFVTAVVTVLATVFWLLVAPSVAGEAAARDIDTRMYPLLYTSPVRKLALLSGRCSAAFLLNAILLLAAQIGIAVAPYTTTVDPDLLGPFRFDAHAVSYLFLALPSAFAATAIQFLTATLTGRPRAAYFGSIMLFLTSYILSGVLMSGGWPELARFLDSMGVMQIVGQLSKLWTPLEMSTRMIPLDAPFLANRITWVGIGLAAFVFTVLRVRLEHRVPRVAWKRKRAPVMRQSPSPAAVSIPLVRRHAGLGTRIRQIIAIGWTSFRVVAKSPAGLVLLVAVPLINVFALPSALELGDAPVLMVTAKVVNALTAPITQLQTPWIAVPLLLILMTGDLVWREREARINDIADATPTPDSVPFLGKFLGIAILLVLWRLLLVVAGILAQLRMGYDAIDVGLYLKTVIVLQLPDYLLFTLLALVIHVVVNQKHLGYLAAVFAFATILLGPFFGLRHNLLRFAGGPEWSYTEMSGFGVTLLPWLWFKLYWAAWAVLIAVATRLLWVRGRETAFRTRLALARRRFTGGAVITAVVAMGLILSLGGFNFYNTIILNRFESPDAIERRQAEYERQYARFRDLPQPRVTDMRLKVELYPERGGLALSGTYRLVNQSNTPIDSIHLSLASGTHPTISLDRPATVALSDDTLDYRILALAQPLAPGDSTTLSFELHAERRGFGNDGISSAIIPNGSFLLGTSWLPQIGYQWSRELNSVGDRKKQGLIARPLYPAPEDVAARSALRGEERMTFEAVMGTSAGQTAVAPGELQQSWEENGRSYFRYASRGPIWNELRFMSAKYTIAEEQWINPSDSSQSVSIQAYHHPGHTAGLERLFSGARAALSYHSEQFGRYPHRHLRFIEHPGEGGALHADETQIDYLEEFSFFDPTTGPYGVDLIFAVVAHEVAHQWWGNALSPAHVTGAPVLSESMAWYTAMMTLEREKGKEGLERLRRYFRQPVPISPVRTGATLMHALDPWLSYRKGPAALYAMREYIGEERVNTAVRALVTQHPTGAVPMVTTLDLYRELEVVTPDSLRYLLHDFFQVNTWWEIKLREAKVVMSSSGVYDVALEFDVRKEVIDTAGNSTEIPIDDLVEIGLFPEGDRGQPGQPVYLEKHRIRSGRQTITVTVPFQPRRAGIDPRLLLLDLNPDNNLADVGAR